MKKYISRGTKWAAFFTIIGILMLLIGIVLMIIKLSDVGLEFTSIGGAISIISLCLYFGERSRWLIIDDSKIVLPRGVVNNGKLIFGRTVVKINEIASVESVFHKGDLIVSGDCFLHTLKLKNGTIITFTLYAYGKVAEKEIIETIKKNIQANTIY